MMSPLPNFRLCIYTYLITKIGNRNLESYKMEFQGQVWQKTQVSQGNSFSDILITGNAPVRSRYET